MSKLVCEEGTDCPCYKKEGERPNPNYVSGGSQKVNIPEGETKYFCMCGQSKNFPYCDGSHTAYNAANGTDLKPQAFTSTETKDYYVCMCGHSKKRPFCDGAHNKLKPAS